MCPVARYSDDEMDKSSRQHLRETINDAWKEVYKQLGRNKASPLNDDDFLRAHWILYYKYSRKTGQDYIEFLLNEQFTPQRIHKKVEREVVLEVPRESRDEDASSDEDEGQSHADDGAVTTVSRADLSPTEIRDYVLSLKTCAVHWFDSFFPSLADTLTTEERRWLDALNRIGISYFRPLVMALLKFKFSPEERSRAFQEIERFIFIVFRMNVEQANYGSSEFYRMVRSLDRGEVDINHLIECLADSLKYAFENPSGVFKTANFLTRCERRLNSGDGFYKWGALHYFLFEYEWGLLSERTTCT